MENPRTIMDVHLISNIIYRIDMEVSQNSGTVPQIISLNGFFHYKPSIFGYTPTPWKPKWIWCQVSKTSMAASMSPRRHSMAIIMFHLNGPPSGWSMGWLGLSILSISILWWVYRFTTLDINKLQFSRCSWSIPCGTGTQRALGLPSLWQC